MTDKDKLIMILYYDFNKNTALNKIIMTVYDAEHHFNSKFDESVRVLVVPTFRGDGNSYFDFINRDKMTDEQLEQFSEALDKYNNILHG